MGRKISYGVVALLFLTLSGAAYGAVINGGFETGSVSGWTLAGSGSAQTAAIGVTPTAGTYQGYIETTGNYTLLAPAVNSSLGVSDSTISGLGAGTPTNGTGISQSITVSTGDVLTFDWDFMTDELDQDPMYNDFGFFTISGSAYLLASRNSSTYDTVFPPTGFDGQTDWATQTYTFTSAGTYTIGFGVFNVGDTGHNSVLLLDAISVPEPGTVFVLPILALPLLGRWRIPARRR